MPVTIQILDYNEIQAQGVPDMELHFNDTMKQYCGQQFMLTGRSHCENREIWDNRGTTTTSNLQLKGWSWHPKWFKVVEGTLVNPSTGQVYEQGYSPVAAQPFVIEKNAWIDNEALFTYYMSKTPVPETIAEVIVTLPANKVADTFIEKTWNFGHWSFTFKPAVEPTDDFTLDVRPHGVRSTSMTTLAKQLNVKTITSTDRVIGLFNNLPRSSVKTHTKDIYLAVNAVCMAMYNIQTQVLNQKIRYERNTIHLRNTPNFPRTRAGVGIPRSSQFNFINSQGHTFYEYDSGYCASAGSNPTQNHLYITQQAYAATWVSPTERRLSQAVYRLFSQIKYFLYDTKIYVFDLASTNKIASGSINIEKPVQMQMPEDNLWFRNPYHGLIGVPIENVPDELNIINLTIDGVDVGYKLASMTLQGSTRDTSIQNFLLSHYIDTRWCQYGSGYYVKKRTSQAYDYRQAYVDICNNGTNNYALGITIDGVTLHPRGKDAFMQKQEMYKRYGISLHKRQINDIEEYDYDCEPVFFSDKSSDEDFYMGAELEVDGGGDDDHSILILENILGTDYAYYMRDGSLNNGFEIAMMPSTLAYVNKNKQKFTDAFKYLSSLDYRSHDTTTCGLHIHFDRTAFGTRPSVQKLKAAYLALIMEKNWNQITKFARRTRSQMNNWSVNKKLSGDVYHDDNEETFTQKFEGKYMDRSKYNALNCNHRYTFELRLFKGTLNANTYLATMQFTHNLINVAKQCKTLDEAQQIKFADIISYKSYPELTKYLGQRALNNTEEEV
jgi:hypothetical protein